MSWEIKKFFLKSILDRCENILMWAKPIFKLCTSKQCTAQNQNSVNRGVSYDQYYLIIIYHSKTFLKYLNFQKKILQFVFHELGKLKVNNF